MIIWHSIKPYLLQQRYWETKVLELRDRKKRELKKNRETQNKSHNTRKKGTYAYILYIWYVNVSY
jgi:hypothetical protein